MPADETDLRVIAHPLRLRLLSLCTRSPVYTWPRPAQRSSSPPSNRPAAG
nr:hypothetical protein [Clavibacter michiganensis]